MATLARKGDAPGLLGWGTDTHPTSANIRLHVVYNARGQMQLNLSKRGLTLIPPQVFQFTQLQVLNMANNQLDILPVMISYLRGLCILNLQHNLLASLPETLVNCRNLAELDLTHNRLPSLPRTMGGLRRLRVLKLGENQLEQVPHEIGALTNLRVLDLHGNRLWYFPFSVQNLHHLIRLDLSDNLFDQIPLVVTKMPWLHALDMSKNHLATLPPDFDQMRELQELNLSENRFVVLGTMISKLRHLKYLSVAHNRLQFLPDQITQLKNLRVLHLQENCLEAMPDEFLQLRILNVSANALKYFSVQQMGQLTALDASHNQLETIPQGLYYLRQLRTLRLAGNRITELAEDVEKLKMLQTLDLSDNDLRRLPDSLPRMNKLTTFNVRGNYKISLCAHPASIKHDSSPKISAINGSNRNEKQHLQRHSSSMPSVYHEDAESHKLQSEKSPKPHKTFASGTKNDQTWIERFGESRNKHAKRRTSWDENMRLRTARSLPYPLDVEYNTSEIRASFSAESLISDEDNRFNDPYLEPTNLSNQNDSDMEASLCSQDDNRKPGYPGNIATHSSQLESTKNVHIPHHQHGQPITTVPMYQSTARKLTNDDNINERIQSQALSQTLSVQTWTQTEWASSSAEAGTQTLLVTSNLALDNGVQQTGKTSRHWGMVKSTKQAPTGLEMAAIHENFIMKKRPEPKSSLTLTDSHLSHYLPVSSSRSNTKGTSHEISRENEGDPRTNNSINDKQISQGTDYTLLGVCNQIQTLLHEDILQPVIGFNGPQTGRFAGKKIAKADNGTWHISQDEAQVKANNVPIGVEYGPGETFTTTENGGQYVSVFCPHVQVSVPPGAIDQVLHVTLQQLTVSPQVLRNLSEMDSFVANIASLGTIVYLSALEKITFSSPVMVTIPAPPRVKGKGHLVVVSVCPDNSCIPCSTGYQSSRDEVTLTTWHMTGKVAVRTKAKCKYKACKSVEHLLSTLNLLTSSQDDHRS